MLRKLLFTLLLTSLLVFEAKGQFYQYSVEFGPLHAKYLEIEIDIVASTPDSVIVMLPVRSSRPWIAPGRNVLNTKGDSHIDQLSNDPLPYVNWDNRDVLFTGYCEIEFKIANDSLATDSLTIEGIPLNYDGLATNNDKVWADFGTPPGYATSLTTKAWTTAIWYRASFTNAFGYGTFAILFIINPNDDDTDNTGTGTFRVYIR